MANETKKHSPTMVERVAKAFGENLPVETLPHTEFKQHSRIVKAIIRTGDFTAYTPKRGLCVFWDSGATLGRLAQDPGACP